MKNILVLCTGNSCRSQMAEGYLRHFSEGKAKIFSAGIEAHGINPNAILVMKEDGIDISEGTSKTIGDLLKTGVNTFDFVITVCDHAKENCPHFPAEAKRLHQNFPDPAKSSGSREEILKSFRLVRDRIKRFSEIFIRQNL